MHKGKAAIVAMLDNEAEAILTIIKKGQSCMSINDMYQIVKANKELYENIRRYEK